MYKGVVSFEADVRRGVGIHFPQIVFRSPVAGVEKVEVEAIIDEAGRNTIKTSVYLDTTPTQAEGVATAVDATANALNRLAFNHKLSIGTARVDTQTFEPIAQHVGGGGAAMLAGTSQMTIRAGEVLPQLGVAAEVVKASLEEASPAGQNYYGLFRLACHSESRTEEFLILYLIVLALCGGKRGTQDEVDRWVKGQDRAVPETRTGRGGKKETVYTRLRNEFGHKRSGVNLDNTKREMASHLERLRELARVAIRTPP